MQMRPALKQGPDRIQELVRQDWERKGRPKAQHIDDDIKGVTYCTFEGTSLTVCCIWLVDERHTLGSAGAVAPADDLDLIQKEAYENAYAKLYAMGGFTKKNAMAGL